MKILLFLAFITVSMVAAADQEEKAKCKCFEDFEPEMEESGWLCRGKKNYRIFSCGEEKPPLCRCIKQNGKEVVLDLGETLCSGIDEQYNNLQCEPKSEWDLYLSRHPERRIYY